MDVINLDFCRAFDMVPQNILLSILGGKGFNAWTMVDKELPRWLHPESGVQQLSIQR